MENTGIPDFQIAHHKIGESHPPFIIAEMSGNHNQSLSRALAIVDAAGRAGAQALKLQTYTAATMTLKGVYTIPQDGSLWAGRELYDLYEEAHTPWEWHQPIFERAKSLGMLAFSTPFDDTAVDFLETLSVPAYKIASFENTDWPLLRKVAQTGKPVILSTGAATLNEIEDAVRVLKGSGCKDLVLLKCTSAYPSLPTDSNLHTIPDMRDKFKCHVGLSDHTFGIGVPLAAIALGARVIEKHFCLSRKEGGVDSAFSLEPDELERLTQESFRAWQALGEINYSVTVNEEKNRVFKRSVYSIQNIKKGQKIIPEMLKVIRPGLGIPAREYDKVLGKYAARDIAYGEPLNWEMLVEE